MGKTPAQVRKAKADKDWATNNPDRFKALKRKAKLKHLYGLTPEEVTELLESQNGLCAICKSIPVKACVDHDHETNEVRGILCHSCNVALGLFKDDIKVLEQAMEYLSGTNSGSSRA